jgi:hypothetical protein
MESRAIDYLLKNRVGCLALAMPDGKVHTAALHYSQDDNPVRLLFQTGSDTKKAQAFHAGKAQASFTIGFSEEEWLTLQIDGVARLLTSAGEIEQFKSIHHAKHPRAAKYFGPETICIELTPDWYRFTDFNTQPETEIEEKL